MMKRTLYWLVFWVGTCMMGPVFGQTITTGALSSATACPGGALTVPFSTSGAFGTGNIFTAELISGGNTYSLGTVSSAPASGTTALSINGTVPANAIYATNYQVRVSASNPGTVTPSNSPTVLTVGTPAPTASAQTLCQRPGTQTITATGTALKWYDAATAGTQLGTGATLPVNTAATGTTNYYVSQTVNGCESARTQVALTVTAAPAAPTVSNQTYCAESAPGALQPTGAGIRWYNGSTQLPGPPAAPNTSGTYSYTVTQASGSCESAAATFTVTVNAAPAAPTVTSYAVCQGSQPQSLTATASSGSTLRWYTVGGTTPLTSLPTLATSNTGSISYEVSQFNGTCESPRATFTFTVNATPIVPAVANSSYCAGSAPGTISPSGANIVYYNGTTPLGSIPSPPNASGTYSYTVGQAIGNCAGPTATFTITVNAVPTTPTVASYAVCQGSAPQSLTATGTSGNTLRWYTPGSNTPLGTLPALATSSPGAFSYEVSQFNGTCESPRATFTFTVQALPASPGVAAPNTTILCQGRTPQPLTAQAASGGTLLWYGTNASTGTASTTAPVPDVSATGTFNYYVSQTVNGCESPRAEIRLVVNAVPAAPNVTASSSLTYCAQGTAQPLAATASANGVLNWYGTSQTGGTSSAQATVPSLVNATDATVNTTYYVSQTVAGCESARATITVAVKPKPGLPGITSTLAQCLALTGVTPAVQPLSATAVSGATLNWYGTGNTASTTPPTPSNAAVGTINYVVSQTLNGCESDRATIAVTTRPTPAAPGTTPVSFCNNATAQPLTATPASGGTLRWYDLQNSALSAAPTPSTTTVTSLTYTVSQIVNGCEGPRAPLAVTINPIPAVPSVQNLTFCQNNPDQPAQNVGPLTATGQSLRWFNPDGNEFPAAPTPSIATAGVTNFQVTQTVLGCQSQRATLSVAVQAPAAPTVPSTSVAYCRGGQSQPLVATGQNLVYFEPNGNNSLTPYTPPTLNATPPGGVFYEVLQIDARGCRSARTRINVVISPPPTLSLSTTTPTVNLGIPATLQLKFTSAAPYSYTLSNGTTGTTRDSIATVQVLPRQTTTYQVAQVSNSCGVGLPGNPATATVTVTIPTITTSALGAATLLCAGGTITVPYTTNGTFNQGNQFKVQLINVNGRDSLDISPLTDANPITATIPANFAGGRYNVRIVGSNPQIPVVGRNSPDTLTIRPRPAATLTGTQDIFNTFSARLNVAFVGVGPWTLTYADSLRQTTVTTNANPFIFEVTPTRTTSYSLVSVSNNCGNGAVSGTAVVRVLPLLGVDDDWLSAALKTYPVPVQAMLTIEIQTQLPLPEAATFQLTNADGRVVLQQTTRQPRTDLDLSRQPAGLYVLRTQMGRRTVLRKILKQ